MQKIDFPRLIAPYRNLLLAALLVFGVTSFLFLRMGARGASFVQEYMEADRLHSRLIAGKLEGVRNLFAFVKKYPAVQPFFHHALYQSFLLEGEIEEAKKLSAQVLERSECLESHYRMFAETSLLIEEGRLEEALKAAIDLQANLKHLNFSEYQKLYIFNLLRIVGLEKRLGIEFSCHKELETLLSKEDTALLGKTKEEILAHFQEGDLSLADFYTK